MQKIGQSTSSANAAGEFTGGNPEAGVEPTQIMVPWLNSVQRELVHAIEGLGGVLDPANDSQLLGVIQTLAGTISDWANIKNRPNALLALSRITSLAANTTLTAAQTGLVLIDANSAPRTITLPASNVELGISDVILRRTDNSGNRLVVQGAGTDRIMFHKHLAASGYPFLVLMGAGDWWHLRSDGHGSWFPLGRYDNTPLGRPVFETTTLFNPGGYGALNGAVLNRADWPWLWDHAQQSGMLSTEAERLGKEGGWTSGDGALTFRGPEGRGEFIRMLDENRGVDASRTAGSWQDGTWLRTVAQEWTGSDVASGNYAFGNAHAQADGRISTAGVGGTVPPGALPPAGAGAYNAASTDNTVLGSVEVNSQALNNWIRFRSRNIAYPGRIKLI